MSKFYRLPVLFIFLFGGLILIGSRGFAQSKADTLTDEMKAKIFSHLNHFTFGFYIDTYSNTTLDNKKDTSNLIPFSANCPVRDQIRINHAAIEFTYSADKVRGHVSFQWGDAPNLLALPESQFIKNLDQANFGFRIVKNLWIDFGYIYNVVGFESSWAIKNRISTVTTGGYFEPGSVLGVKLSYKFSDKVDGGIMAGNPYSLAYGRNTNIAGLIFVNWHPLQNLTLSYNNFFGNQALKDADINNNLLYNNLILNYYPIPQVQVVGQLDFGLETNAKLAPDTDKLAYVYSGFIMARYEFLRHFAVTARLEIFNDPDAILSAVYEYNGETRGLLMRGGTVGFEYRPVKIAYVRLEYRYLHANDGNKVFYSNQLDHLNVMTFSTGVRF
ncbi:MAG TPA: outer membrane beta-barrel protein [Bacteroidales bacterium]|nr:outer membrane beta-barrel protein [Bacteroidales bacterium]